MLKGNELLSLIQNYLADWNLSRLKLVVLFTHSVLKIGIKSLLEIAGAFDTEAQRESSLQRIERFLNTFDFCISAFGRLMIGVMGLGDKKITLLLDRTEWKLESVWVNIWMLSVSVEGMSIPLYWRVYNKKGLSSQAERIAFMRSFFGHFPDLQVDYLVADREFIGSEWFRYLSEEAKISFLMRLKENFQVSKNGEQKPLKGYCRDVKPYQYYYKGHFKVCYTDLYVSVTRIANELLILGSLERDMHAFELYKKRWGIETLFKALKTQEFCIENTAVRDAQKMQKLLFLLAFAFVWAYKTGLCLNEEKPIRISQNGHREFSFFRYGFIYLQNALLNVFNYQKVIWSIRKLSGD